jgi:hypothetical protein
MANENMELTDTPPSFLRDLIANPKAKTSKGEGVGVRSLACNTLGVEERVKALRWD